MFSFIPTTLHIPKGTTIGMFAAIIFPSFSPSLIPQIIEISYVLILIISSCNLQLVLKCRLSLVLLIIELIFQPIRSLARQLSIMLTSGGSAGKYLEKSFFFV